MFPTHGSFAVTDNIVAAEVVIGPWFRQILRSLFVNLVATKLKWYTRIHAYCTAFNPFAVWEEQNEYYRTVTKLWLATPYRVSATVAVDTPPGRQDLCASCCC
eukprot:TRINITY_DN68465_c0_g1_i1.p2 TRINITY_DN68465_c0_g1~~TRINITY_DN68465_c0_g1_i1.p2  ORF type:complete len:103 (-),score=0.99 TRINITY_DN68465_c0_g1_i1:402-710(-)